MIKKILNKTKKILGWSKVYVFGDSHTQVFDWLNNYKKTNVFHITRVDGATALGMVNPNSKTNALPLFMETIKLLPKKTKLIFLLGEVDIGFLLWYRSEKLGLDLSEQLEKTIENYITFILKLKKTGYSNIVVLSAPPPCVADENLKLQVIELRREVKANLKTRTELSVKYNEMLKSNLSKMDVTFVNLYDNLIDEKNGIVNKKYLSNDKTEHHLDSENFGLLIYEKLSSMNIIKK